MRISIITGLGLLCLMGSQACAQAGSISGRDVKLEVASDDVPGHIEQEARGLAEKAELLLNSLLEARMVYVGTETMRRKTEAGDDHPDAVYRVIHYRYDDDTAIHTMVSVEDALVLEQTEFPHLPTPLARQELEMASALAMKDGRVREALGDDVGRVKIEALLIRAADENDPWFGRRVMQLLFRVASDYRHSPRVIVDLTERVVLLDLEDEGDAEEETEGDEK